MKKPAGVGTRLWFALMGINRELEQSMQTGLHRARKTMWDWVAKQPKGVQLAIFTLRSLAREVGNMAWDAKDGIHVGARIGWHEGGHRHTEARELRELRKRFGKDHPDYKTAVERIRAERTQRNTEYAIYSTKFRLAAHKGERPPRARDVVTPIPDPPAPKKTPRPKPSSDKGDWSVTVVGDRLRRTFPGLTEKDARELAAWYDQRIKGGNGSATVTLAAPPDLAAPTGSEDSSNANGGTAVTAPTVGGDVTSISDMRRQYEAAINAVTAIHDQVAAATAKTKEVATAFESAAASLSAEGHDSQTVADAHASMETLNSLATQLEQQVAAADAATATLNTGLQGLERHRALEEAVSSHSGPANRTAAYRPS